MEDKNLEIWDKCLVYLYDMMIISPEHGNVMSDIMGLSKDNVTSLSNIFKCGAFNNDYYEAYKDCVDKIVLFEMLGPDYQMIMEFMLERFSYHDIIGICRAKKLV